MARIDQSGTYCTIIHSPNCYRGLFFLMIYSVLFFNQGSRFPQREALFDKKHPTHPISYNFLCIRNKPPDYPGCSYSVYWGMCIVSFTSLHDSLSFFRAACFLGPFLSKPYNRRSRKTRNYVIYLLNFYLALSPRRAFKAALNLSIKSFVSILSQVQSRIPLKENQKFVTIFIDRRPYFAKT